MMQEKLTYTVKEVAQVLGCGLNKTYEVIRDGKLPSFKYGKKYMVSAVELKRLIERMQNGIEL